MLDRKPNKTYCQLTLDTVEHSEEAMHTLNLKIIKPKKGTVGLPLRICKYEKINPNSFESNQNSLTVRNLSSQVTAREFYEIFLEFGEIKSAKLEVDAQGNSKGYGFVTFQSAQSANQAISHFRGKEVKGKKIEITTLVSHKGTETKNVIYVKHLPYNIDEVEVRKLFSQYGDIASVKLTKDNNGNITGAGIVSFNDSRSASAAIADIKLKPKSFPGQLPLYVAYLQTKEERVGKSNLINLNKPYQKKPFNEPQVIFAKLTDINLFMDQDSFLKNIKLFIKVVMVSEYNPLNIIPNFEKKSALITFRCIRDVETFMNAYSKMINPEFYFSIVPTSSMPPQEMTPHAPLGLPWNTSQQGKGFGMVQGNSNFPQLPIPGMKFGIPVPKYPVQQTITSEYSNHPVFPTSQPQYGEAIDKMSSDDLSNEIYDIVSVKFPENASKITGMIVDLGEEEMRRLLLNKQELYNLMLEAHEVSYYYFHYIDAKQLNGVFNFFPRHFQTQTSLSILKKLQPITLK